MTGTSTLWWVRDGEVSQHQVDPTAFGIALAPVDALRGGEAATNAQIAREVFSGARQDAVRDAVLLNAGIALAVLDADQGGRFGAADTFEAALSAGIDRAAASIDTGATVAALHRWVAASAALSG